MNLRRTTSPLRFALASVGAVLVGALLTGCASPGGGGEGVTGDASCAAVVEYDGHTYVSRGALTRDPATTGRLLPGAVPACDDTGGLEPGEPARSVKVAELADVPMETAVMLEGSIYVRDGRELPAITQSWFRAPGCTTQGGFELTADWLGVTGPKKPRFDGDLRPPYRLEVHVTAGPSEYVGATVRLHADADTDPGLGPKDVKASLWKGGQVVARVICDDGRLHATALRVPPPG